jgi:hypothetical protein
MLLGTNIATGRKNSMEKWQKNQLFYKSRVTHRHGEGKSFYGVHGVDRVVGNGPNAFPVEIASGNGGIGGTEMLPGRFWKTRRQVRREEAWW